MPQLRAVVALEDIADVEGFVNATLNASGIEFQPDERDELVAEGLAILYQLHQRFERRRAGYTQDGRFSGFAAMYLPRKLGDAWHRARPEHRYITDPDTGKRSWAFFKAHTSLDGLTEGTGGRRGHGAIGNADSLAEASLLHGRYWIPVAQAA